jgi:hypothetical protein
MNYSSTHPLVNTRNGNGGGSHRPKTRDFEPFFTSSNWASQNGWRSMSKAVRKDKGLFPNLVFYHPTLREVMVPLLIKGPPECAATLGAPLIDHYVRRVRDTDHGRLDPGDKGVRQAWVAFAHADCGVYIGSTTIEAIANAIGDAAPNPSTDPAMPPYFWIDGTGQVSTREMWLARQPDDLVF